MRKGIALSLASVIAASSTLIAPHISVAAAPGTTTPIKHVVVIFQENVSFDHYFGTYPNALNPAGSPKFTPLPGTPKVNGLTTDLLTHNPNAANPLRLDRTQAITDDMNHEYTAEQKAVNGGKMDKFVEETNGGDWPFPKQSTSMVMNYFDGNTVTALWNYAQHFAMSDSSYGTTYGPSTPGALNLISGQTAGATGYKDGQAVGNIADNVAQGAVIGDPDPYYDTASNPKRAQAAMSGKNVGDLMTAKEITWGWFQGGFRNTKSVHYNLAGVKSTDYNPHHQPFQYYQSTSNPNHLPPTSVDKVGYTDQANHQYDLTDFWSAVNAGNMPAVSFLKAANYQDGHAGYSDPIAEQNFVVDTINRLQKTPAWKDTAVVISYDDSDGWYDHAAPPVVNHSNDPETDTAFVTGKPDLGTSNDRAGFGPRLPLLVISPYAKANFVDHTVTDQSSVLKFIEDNWNLGRIGDGSFDAVAGSINGMFDFTSGPVNPTLMLNPITGTADQEKTATIKVNGETVFGDVAPYFEDGRTMVPARVLGQALGATVTWDAVNQAVLVNTPAYPGGIAEGSGITLVVNGVVLPVHPAVHNSRVFVPVRAIAETLHGTVTWDQATYSVNITK